MNSSSVPSQRYLGYRSGTFKTRLEVQFDGSGARGYAALAEHVVALLVYYLMSIPPMTRDRRRRPYGVISVCMGSIFRVRFACTIGVRVLGEWSLSGLIEESSWIWSNSTCW